MAVCRRRVARRGATRRCGRRSFSVAMEGEEGGREEIEPQMNNGAENPSTPPLAKGGLGGV